MCMYVYILLTHIFSTFYTYSFNGIEMGTYVGLKILEEHLDPISYEFKQKYLITTRADAFVPFKHITTTTATTSRIPSIPTFVLPKTISCTLPGDLYYFYSRLPVLPKDILDYKTSNFPLYASVMTVENRNCILNVSEVDDSDDYDNNARDNDDDHDDDDYTISGINNVLAFVSKIIFILIIIIIIIISIYYIYL